MNDTHATTAHGIPGAVAPGESGGAGTKRDSAVGGAAAGTP
ncbi:hypothetical protein [Acrocarpospora macrocephala]